MAKARKAAKRSSRQDVVDTIIKVVFGAADRLERLYDCQIQVNIDAITFRSGQKPKAKKKR